MRPSADVTPRRFPPPWIVDETDAVLHRPRRHRDCGLLAPRLTDKIDPIRYTPKTIGDFASRRAHQQNQSLKPTGGAVTTEGKRRGKHRAELPRTIRASPLATCWPAKETFIIASPFCKTPRKSTPSTIPKTVPRPPVNDTPPSKIAVRALSSKPTSRCRKGGKTQRLDRICTNTASAVATALRRPAA